MKKRNRKDTLRVDTLRWNEFIEMQKNNPPLLGDIFQLKSLPQTIRRLSLALRLASL